MMMMRLVVFVCALAWGHIDAKPDRVAPPCQSRNLNANQRLFNLCAPRTCKPITVMTDWTHVANNGKAVPWGSCTLVAGDEDKDECKYHKTCPCRARCPGFTACLPEFGSEITCRIQCTAAVTGRPGACFIIERKEVTDCDCKSPFVP